MNKKDELHGICRLPWYQWRPPTIPVVTSVLLSWSLLDTTSLIDGARESGMPDAHANRIIYFLAIALAGSLYWLFSDVKKYRTKFGLKLSSKEFGKWMKNIQQLDSANQRNENN